MKSNKTILLVVGVVLVIVFGAWYVFANSKSEVVNDMDSTTGVVGLNGDTKLMQNGTSTSKAPDMPTKTTLHTYKFVGTVVIDSDAQTSSVDQENVATSTGLFNGYKGRVALTDGTCKLNADGMYSFTVTYNETDKEYKCIEAKFINNKGNYGF